MLESPYLYLALNILTISFPLIRSFESRIQYAKSFGPLFKSIAIVGAFFIIWDIWFTVQGVWGFTPDYLTGIDLLHLPIEEWLFFLTVPFACIFIYRVLNYFFPKNRLGEKGAKNVTVFLSTFALVLAIMHYDRLYTVVNFGLLAIYLLAQQYYFKSRWLADFYRAYLVAVIPFFLVNGILTGSFLETQIVWYNPSEHIGIRMGTIPVEDLFYGLLLIMLNVHLYERFRGVSVNERKHKV